MLGANLGTALTAAILSLDLHWLGSALIFIGVVTFKFGRFERGRGVGRALLGLGLMLLALQLLSTVTQPLATSRSFLAMLEGLQDAPAIALAIAAGLAILSSSSLAVVLLIASLASTGLVSAPLTVILVAGANLGGAVPPLMAVLREGVDARRLTGANLLVRAAGAVTLTICATLAASALVNSFGADHLAIVSHLALNLALLVVFLPLTNQVGRLMGRLFPRIEDEQVGPDYLDDASIGSPIVALSGAEREALRIGDLVKSMLERNLASLHNADPGASGAIAQIDDRVDLLQEAVKLYLSRLDTDSLEARHLRRSNEIVSYAVNLEHVGDIVEMGLSVLAAKKARKQLNFSDEGLAEIDGLYRFTIDNLRLAQTVFHTSNPALARQLVDAKVEVRRQEQLSAALHLERVRKRRIATLETSSLHLDILRDLKRINAHLASVAYPILDELGALQDSRLRDADPTSVPAGKQASPCANARHDGAGRPMGG
jgi:phosphate:Na+ symporter